MAGAVAYPFCYFPLFHFLQDKTVANGKAILNEQISKLLLGVFC